jgi:hypothetical protein
LDSHSGPSGTDCKNMMHHRSSLVYEFLIANLR